MVVKLRDNGNKLFNLMQEYKITNRILDERMNLEELFSQKVNWNIINIEIKERRASSLEYLKRMIIK